jgi:hypothetical protein
MMVLNIVDANRWGKPIYFASTVSDDNLMGLVPFLQTQGLVYRILPERVTADNHYDLSRSIALVDSVYKFQGIGKAKFNDTSRRLLNNYLQIAFDLRRPMAGQRQALNALKTAQGDTKSETTADTSGQQAKPDGQLAQAQSKYDADLAAVQKFYDVCVNLMPWDWRPRGIRHEFYIDHGMIDEAILAMEQALIDDPANGTQYEALLDQARKMKERG